MKLRGEEDPAWDDAAWQLVVETAALPDADLALLDWCGTNAVDLEHHGFARDTWETMAARQPDSALPYIGLTNAYYQLGREEPAAEGQLALFQRSVAAGRRAMELDPMFYQSYWNTFLPLWRTRRLERGSEAELTLDDWRELLDLADRSLRYNGLQPETLNAAAYAHVRLFERDGETAHLGHATRLIRRAIRLTERQVQGRCVLKPRPRQDLSDYYDTLRDLQERAGDLPAALATARAALDVLEADDPDVGKRSEQVARLEGLVTDGN
jgi:hypothetical protein